MTLIELKTMVGKFVTDLYYDAYFDTSDGPQATAVINWAIRAFSVHTWCNYHHKITLTLSEGEDYVDCRSPQSVSRKVLYPVSVTIAGNVLCGPDRRAGLWSLADLKRFHEGFQSYDNAESRRAIWLPNNKLLLSPPPDAATAALANHYIEGVYLAADLKDSTDDENSPDIPEECHEMLAYFATMRAILPETTEAQAWQKVGAYRAEWVEEIERMASQNKQAILGPSSIRGLDSDWLNNEIYLR